MKTNAKAETIEKAVKTVSKEKYEGNVIFRKEPEKITKNVLRFTLKTKDANKIGSLEIAGRKQPKANWQVHTDVIQEIFKLEPKANIYVDTIAGRLYNSNIVEEKKEKEKVTSGSKKQFMKSLKYILDHKEMLEKIMA